MANEEHLAILKQGVESWNQWRRGNPDVQPDLSAAKLEGEYNRGAYFDRTDLTWASFCMVHLREADLHEVDLRGAILTGANLFRANLSRAELQEAWLDEASLGSTVRCKADLTGANLALAEFDHADLRGARLPGADLSFTRFRGTNLVGVDLTGASLYETTFADVDLSQVRGLETVRHEAPSTIGINTLYRSGWNIPEAFLRGCGVPEQFVEYARLLVGKSIEYQSCFISYSSKDEECAQLLYADLQLNNVRCWFAPEHMKIGDHIRLTIDETIRGYDKLLLICSEVSVHSQWVEHEVEAALEKERREGRPVLFPIRVDDAVMEYQAGWASLLRNTRNIFDLTLWKERDAYQKAFQRILRDLKAK